MNKFLISLLLTASLATQAGDLELDFSLTNIDHAWRGPNNVANFSQQLKSIGIAYWTDNNWGFRAAYGEAGDMHTLGKYSDYTIDLKNIVSLEILYKWDVNDKFYIFGGIGQYYIPLPITNETTGFYEYDRDDDNGYFAGVGYNINKRVSLQYRYTQYSRITSSPYDEWTRGHGLHIVIKF